MARPAVRKPKPRRGVAATLVDGLLARPAATGGGVVMVCMAAAIASNALLMQPGRHPAPLFVGTRPVAEEPATARAEPRPQARPDDIDALIAETTGRPAPAYDHGLVADVQGALKAAGYYEGDVDGLPGPMTAAAVLRFQKDHGLEPTGEADGDVLAALKAAAGRQSSLVPDVAPEPDVAPDPVPLPPTAPPKPSHLAADEETGSPQIEPASIAPKAIPAPEPAVARLPLPENEVEPTPPADPAVAGPAAQPSDPRLARIQESLDLFGFGPIDVDGRMSEQTRAAIRRFQVNQGLAETGTLDQAFLERLIAIGGLSDQ